MMENSTLGTLVNGDKEVDGDDADHHIELGDELNGDENSNGGDMTEQDPEEIAGDSRSIEGDDGTPCVGMVFKSYEEVSHFYKQYALHVGFGVAVRKSSFTKSGMCRRLILACAKGGRGRPSACYQARQSAKTNCPAMIIVKLWGDGLLHLAEVNLEHNHVVSPSTARLMRCYKRTSVEMKEDPAVQGHGLENAQSGDKEWSNHFEGGLLKLEEGNGDVILQFFADMQSKNPNFFYLVNLDREGRLRNLFWADARSRVACQYFGDVIALDTTYLIDKYDLPLVLFIGMNHHGQSVLLGCALLSDETTETYLWLLKTWLTCMLGCQPTALITDDCQSIKDAVAEVFPGVRYRLCLFHIIKRMVEKLRGFEELKAIKKAFNRAIFDSLRVEEFEAKWKNMIEQYGLEDNGWLISLFENRHSWAPVFQKDTFWAGLSIFKHGDNITSFFDGIIYPRTSLKQFISKYEAALENKYKRETHAEMESLNKIPLIVSKFYMEEQVCKLYTLSMFKKFQDELKATMYCNLSIVRVDGQFITFEVKECSYMEDGRRTEHKDHEVLYNANSSEVQCVCGSFQVRGILCRHALAVFKLQQVFEIPSVYILDRWRKDFKRLHALSHSPKDEIANNTTERFDYLSMRCLQLVELGMASDSRYQLALNLVREMEKCLLDDSACMYRQPKQLSFKTQASEKMQLITASDSKNSEGSKSSSSLLVKRRGRPPKKGLLCDLEMNKGKDFLRTHVGTGNSIFQAPATNALQLEGYIGEEVGPNDLSFGGPLNMHLNQHQTGNEERVQLSSPFQSNIAGSDSPKDLVIGGYSRVESWYQQQTIGNQSRMQWIYQQMLQEDHIPRAPSGQRTG